MKCDEALVGVTYPRISGWLAEVKLDLETPDLWAELQQETRLFGAISDGVTKDTPFTSDELNKIATLPIGDPVDQRLLDAAERRDDVEVG